MTTFRERNPYLKPKICVSGAAETEHCGAGALEKAKELGKEIAGHHAVLVTGATTGFPLWSAVGAKEAGGVSIGLSPAVSEREHVDLFKLPLEYMDLIIYTGFNYSGRNLLLTRSSDAVIVGCGRMGTLNEFTIAYEDGKPVGVLEGDWTTDELIHKMITESHRGMGRVVFESDPKALVEKILEMIAEDKEKIINGQKNGNGNGGEKK